MRYLFLFILMKLMDSKGKIGVKVFTHIFPRRRKRTLAGILCADAPYQNLTALLPSWRRSPERCFCLPKARQKPRGSGRGNFSQEILLWNNVTAEPSLCTENNPDATRSRVDCLPRRIHVKGSLFGSNHKKKIINLWNVMNLLKLDKKY